MQLTHWRQEEKGKLEAGHKEGGQRNAYQVQQLYELNALLSIDIVPEASFTMAFDPACRCLQTALVGCCLRWQHGTGSPHPVELPSAWRPSWYVSRLTPRLAHCACMLVPAATLFSMLPSAGTLRQLHC